MGPCRFLTDVTHQSAPNVDLLWNPVRLELLPRLALENEHLRQTAYFPL